MKDNNHYSIYSKLKKENKVDKNFMLSLEGLTLEEVIGLKLESACNIIDGKLYGIPLWNSLRTIVNDAIMMYTHSASKSKADASRFLGIDISNYNSLLRRYKTKSYFQDSVD